MDDAEAESSIVSDPQIMDGLPTIRGTRIPVYVVLEMVEAGLSLEQILIEYPHLTRRQLQAAVHYACQSVTR